MVLRIPSVDENGRFPDDIEARLEGMISQPGPPGAGVPAGGAPLQVVRKNAVGNTTEWVTPSKAMVGLSNVDNTKDEDKPVSTPQAVALGMLTPSNGARPVGKNELVINVLDYGTPTNVEDTAMLQAAANAAKAQRIPLWVPNGVRLRITSPVDMRHIDVQFDGFLTVAQTEGYGVLVGDNSSVRVGRTISFKSALHLNASTQTNPVIRVVGLMGGFVSVGRCDYFQIYADGSVALDDASAYSTYSFTGGSVRHLEILGENGQGWINENLFLGGDFRRITIRGTYTHNSNTFIKPSLEGVNSVLDIQRGARNKFLWLRGEYGPKVRFGEGAWHNIVVDGFTSNPQNKATGITVEYDNGVENVVTAAIDDHLRPYELWKLDASTDLFDTARPYPGASVRPGLKNLQVDSSFQAVLSSPILPIRQGPVWLRRFELRSDVALWRPRVRFYDENMQRLDVAANTYMDLNGNWAPVAGGEYYQFLTGVSSCTILVTSRVPKYMSIEVYASGSTAGAQFEYLKLTGYTSSPEGPALVETWRKGLTAPMFGATPTRGRGRLGLTIQTPTGATVCVARTDTAVTSAVAASSTNITIASASGIQVGDIVGVLLADGATHWSTAAGISGSSVTLNSAVPSGAAVGAPVVASRWR